MKIYIEIGKRQSTSMWCAFDYIGFYGWKKIARALCDEIVKKESSLSSYNIQGLVASKDVFWQRFKKLSKEQRERIRCVMYPNEHHDDSYLYYDKLSQFQAGDYSFSEDNISTEGHEIVAYSVRQWLNDGKEPDQPEPVDDFVSSYDFFNLEEGNDDDNPQESNDDYSIYAPFIYELFHRDK